MCCLFGGSAAAIKPASKMLSHVHTYGRNLLLRQTSVHCNKFSFSFFGSGLILLLFIHTLYEADRLTIWMTGWLAGWIGDWFCCHYTDFALTEVNWSDRLLDNSILDFLISFVCSSHTQTHSQCRNTERKNKKNTNSQSHMFPFSHSYVC